MANLLGNRPSLNHYLSSLFLSLLFTFTFQHIAEATTHEYHGCLMPIAESQGYYTDHYLQTWVTYSSTCNGNNSGLGSDFYIDPSDKEMYAFALTAAMNKLQVDIYYDDGAPSVTVLDGGSSVSTPCRVETISLYYSGSGCTGHFGL